jgi:hypothetical protein
LQQQRQLVCWKEQAVAATAAAISVLLKGQAVAAAAAGNVL